MALDAWYRNGLWVIAAVAACEAPKGAASGGSAQAPAATTAAQAPPPADPPPPPPPDLDLAAQEKALKCIPKPKPGPCAVLAAMKDCKKWSMDIPSGDGRWLGWGYTVSQGKEERAPFVVKAKRVNQQDVGPGQLNFKLGLEELSKALGMPYDHAERAIGAWERGDMPPKNSQAVEYAQKSTVAPDVFLTRTQGGHVYGLAHGGLWVCEVKQRLLFVRKAATRSSSGDGLYGEVHGVSW